MPSTPENFELPEGWLRPTADAAEHFHAELQRELSPGHLLHGAAVETFAFLGGTDDVLFRHRGMPGRFTMVHLTYRGRTEINSQFPNVEFDGSFSGFLAYYEQVLRDS